jgi:hypothetical protein
LSPNLRNGQWTEEEDRLLREKFQEFGAKWSLIVAFFPSRSEVNLKNRWTQLSNRGIREQDMVQEKLKVIQGLDSVISGVKAAHGVGKEGIEISEGDPMDWDFAEAGPNFDFIRQGFDYGPFQP